MQVKALVSLLLSLNAACGCRITGQPGVALDDLVYIMTRVARKMEDEGVDKMFSAAEQATQLMKVCLGGGGSVVVCMGNMAVCKDDMVAWTTCCEQQSRRRNS